MPSVAVSAVVSAKMITIDPPRSASTLGFPTAGLNRFVDRVRAAIGMDGQIDVLLADDATLRRLNRTWRGKNKPTDVLSFAAAGEHVPGQTMAGDLAISLDVAARQAMEHGHALGKEVRILILHGTLHLAGYDHETDSGEMAEREAELRKRLRLPSGLIGRSETASEATGVRAVPRSRLPGKPAKAPGKPFAGRNPMGSSAPSKRTR